ncbi:MAG: ATP-binding protein [Gemmatimonadetes bacterium]|nr:ATP-binding protein [Gemmatimonadota bacterium]
MPISVPPSLRPSIPKPPEVVDRDAVWGALSDMWHRPEAALLMGLGRRRAGKSWVLARFARAVHGIYYQATKRTETEQLAALSQLVGERFGDAALSQGVAFPHWDALFGYLTRQAAGGPLLLVLDEFPYLAEAAPALPSILQAVWDHQWSGAQVKVILNGSHISAMRRLEASDQPLYGRRTGRLQFPPFTLEHVPAFVPGYGARDVLRTYGIFGGLPGHLALLRPDESLAANVARLILDPGGRLADDAERLLDGFLGEADVHYSILQAIANGQHTWSRITSRVGKPGGSLSRPMRWLEEMQVVARHVPITDDPRTSRRASYRLADPYLAFWHRFVAPLVAAGETSLTSPDALWSARIAPALNDHMGHVFEELCRGWAARSTRLPFRPVRVGAWWDGTSEHEIDVVALGPDRELLVGECKWGPVDDHDLVRLRARATRLHAELPASAQGGPLIVACFSARGEWGPGVARDIASGAVQGVRGEELLAG